MSDIKELEEKYNDSSIILYLNNQYIGICHEFRFIKNKNMFLLDFESYSDIENKIKQLKLNDKHYQLIAMNPFKLWEMMFYFQAIYIGGKKNSYTFSIKYIDRKKSFGRVFHKKNDLIKFHKKIK